MDRDIAPAVNQLNGNTAYLKRQLDTHWERLEREQSDPLAPCPQWFKSMGFWARVRWIVRGTA